MIQKDEITQKLDKIAFFQSFSQQDRDALLALDCFAEYAPEECLIYQHGFDQTIFFLIEGSVRIVEETKPQHPLARISEPGIPFGELAFLARQFRSANVIADIPTLVLRLDEANFKALPTAIKSRIQRDATKKLMTNKDMINQMISRK